MKKRLFLFFSLFSFFVYGIFGLTADNILKSVEERTIGAKAPKDIEAIMIMKIHRGDSVKIRKLKVWTKNIQKRDDWRIMKFISPADVKNVGLLTLSEKEMYIYLPEFHRIRRIASSNKKDSFMGSDFSYEDLSTGGFSKNYNAEILKEDSEFWTLKLVRKKGIKKPYSKIILKVDKKSYMPVKMELYDNDGNLWKIAEEKNKKINNYYITTYIKMEDKKKGSWTSLELENIKLDQNLSKKFFTKRFLKRRVK